MQPSASVPPRARRSPWRWVTLAPALSVVLALHALAQAPAMPKGDPPLPAGRFPTYVLFRGDPDNQGFFSNMASLDIPDTAPFYKEAPFFAVGFYMPLEYPTWGIVFSFGNQSYRDRGLIAASTNPPGGAINLFEWHGAYWKNLAFAPTGPKFGAWSHMAIVLNSSTERAIYHDGVKSAVATSAEFNVAPTVPWPTAASGQTLSFTFGSYYYVPLAGAADAHNFNGGLRDYAIVTGVPTEAELKRHRAGENAIVIWGAARVWGSWAFTANPRLGQKERDLTGHGHDLTYADRGSLNGHAMPVLVTPEAPATPTRAGLR